MLGVDRFVFTEQPSSERFDKILRGPKAPPVNPFVRGRRGEDCNVLCGSSFMAKLVMEADKPPPNQLR